MPKFHFDYRDGDLVVDPTLNAARMEADVALSELANNELTGTYGALAIEVGDADRQPLFRANSHSRMIDTNQQAIRHW